MEITAALVKQLRDETDAPMMECKSALVEANGDYDRAKEILRERGKAVASKKAGRDTTEGIAKFVTSGDHSTAAGVVIECETDFVSGNDSFKAMVDKVAQGLLSADSGTVKDNPNSVNVDGTSIEQIITESISVIRENIQLATAIKLDGGGSVAVYNHHTGKQAAAVVVSGTASNLIEVGNEIALQVVAARDTEYLKKDDVPQEAVEKELQIEVERAVQEGKPREMAEKIAQGRINKEFYKSRVLLEQPFWKEQSQSVSQFVAEQAKAGGGTIEVVSFHKLTVGG